MIALSRNLFQKANVVMGPERLKRKTSKKGLKHGCEEIPIQFLILDLRLILIVNVGQMKMNKI
jgi:hypothetical protein